MIIFYISICDEAINQNRVSGILCVFLESVSEKIDPI